MFFSSVSHFSPCLRVISYGFSEFVDMRPGGSFSKSYRTSRSTLRDEGIGAISQSGFLTLKRRLNPQFRSICGINRQNRTIILSLKYFTYFHTRLCIYQFVTSTSPLPRANPRAFEFFDIFLAVKFPSPSSKKLFKCPTCKTCWMGKCPTPGAFFYLLTGQGRFKTLC